jgi:hypothetical protein
VRLDVTLEHLLKFPWSLVEGNVVLGENLRDGRELFKIGRARIIHLEPFYDLASGHQFAPFALELGAVNRRHMRAKLRLAVPTTLVLCFQLHQPLFGGHALLALGGDHRRSYQQEAKTSRNMDSAIVRPRIRPRL